MDNLFYEKCLTSNQKIITIYNDLIHDKELKNNIRKINEIKNIRIINSYYSFDNNVDKEINYYPGISFEVLLVNGVLIELSAPPEKNTNNELNLEINVINQIIKINIEKKINVKFPLMFDKINDLKKKINDLSMLKINIIKN